MMLTKKLSNYVLQELGITVWKLRYPVVLDNKKLIKLWTHIRLLLISDILISMDDSFIQDVIRAMQINCREVYVLTVPQIKNMLFPTGFYCHCWWIGVEVLVDLHGISVSTPSLSVLKNNIAAKYDLWCQIYRVMYDM